MWKEEEGRGRRKKKGAMEGVDEVDMAEEQGRMLRDAGNDADGEVGGHRGPVEDLGVDADLDDLDDAREDEDEGRRRKRARTGDD